MSLEVPQLRNEVGESVDAQVSCERNEFRVYEEEKRAKVPSLSRDDKTFPAEQEHINKIDKSEFLAEVAEW